MKIDPSQSIGQIAVLHKEAIPVFEKYKIDYIGQGERSLKDACYVRGIALEDVWGDLGKLETSKEEWFKLETDWSGETMESLVGYILKTHHGYTRTQLDRIERMIDEMASLDSERSPKLLTLQKLFVEFSGEFRDHMLEEEEVFFPYLIEAERAKTEGEPIPRPFKGFSPLTHPLRILISDHGMMGKQWREMEELTDGFLAPPRSGRRLAELYKAFQALEKDNQRHIHLENNILFHRAAEMGLLDDDGKKEEAFGRG